MLIHNLSTKATSSKKMTHIADFVFQEAENSQYLVIKAPLWQFVNKTITAYELCRAIVLCIDEHIKQVKTGKHRPAGM